MLNIANYERNANKNHNEVLLHSGQNSHHQSLQIINAGGGVEKRELSYSVGGNVYWCNKYGKQYGVSFKKKKSCHVIQQSHSWAYIWRKTILRKDTCNSIFIAALFIIAKTWKQPKCPSTDEWIEKMWDIYTMDC